jgi:hypothetical protein
MEFGIMKFSTWQKIKNNSKNQQNSMK